jgi:hypothetical protein
LLIFLFYFIILKKIKKKNKKKKGEKEKLHNLPDSMFGYSFFQKQIILIFTIF